MATDLISVSQGQLLTNFTQLNTVFGGDHVEFNNATSANRGKHTVVHLRQQGSDGTTTSGEGALYVKANNLYFRQASNGTVIQLTGASTAASSGTILLANGIRMNWGNATGVWQGVNTVTYATAFSSAAWSITLTAQLTAAFSGLTVYASGTTTFTPTSSYAPSHRINYIAIGPA
jgi:hypothetical protein